MANFALTFFGTEESETNEHKLQCFLNNKNHIFIHIDMDSDSNYHKAFICLDKSTAIKLAKTLRTEINKMEDESNGNF